MEKFADLVSRRFLSTLDFLAPFVASGDLMSTSLLRVDENGPANYAIDVAYNKWYHALYLNDAAYLDVSFFLNQQ